MKTVFVLALLSLCACSKESPTCARPVGPYTLTLDSPTCGKKTVDVYSFDAKATANCTTVDDTFEGCTLDRSTICDGFADHLSLHVDSPTQLSGSYEADADAGPCDYTATAVAK